MKVFLSLILSLLIVGHAGAVSQHSSDFYLLKSSENTIKTSKKVQRSYAPHVSVGVNTGVASCVIRANDIQVAYPYQVYSYYNNSFQTFTVLQQAHLNASPSKTQFILGLSAATSFKKNTYVEADVNAWSPLSGSHMTSLAGGGGVCARSDAHAVEVRLGFNFFRINRKAQLGTIENGVSDVIINGTTFYHEYYSSRKKDSVTVYDKYESTRISVSYNESCYGIQPKLILGFDDGHSPAFVRLHLSWNLPMAQASFVKFNQQGYKVDTYTTKPTIYKTETDMSVSVSNPFLHYQQSGTSPSYTAGFFAKLEIGIKLLPAKGDGHVKRGGHAKRDKPNEVRYDHRNEACQMK